MEFKTTKTVIDDYNLARALKYHGLNMKQIASLFGLKYGTAARRYKDAKPLYVDNDYTELIALATEYKELDK